MNAVADPKAAPAAGAVRPDFVPTEHYTSVEFLRREQERLWPKVWQVACREQDVARVGAFVTYDIMDESIVVVRTSETEIRGFFNVCQHRGRRLTDGCGLISQFHCRFHGWQYGLDGKIARVLDREDWAGCPDFTDEDLSLTPVQVDTWGGFVFINMDPQAKPLRAFLDAVPSFLDPFELEKMSYRWHASVKIPCNWKVALEAFSEGYHVSSTHPQLMPMFGDDRTHCRNYGVHSMYSVGGDPNFPMGGPSPRINMPQPKDYRPKIIDYFEEFNRTLRAFFTERDVEAARRVLTEVSPDASPGEILMKVMEFQREAAIAAGAGWPDISIEQIMAAGIDWHIFPNIVLLPYPDGALAYRALPHASDPNTCLFEVYSLQRFAPGGEPPIDRRVLHGDGDWRKFKEISLILQQDFDNMGEVQRGMKSQGFKGARPNPLQETPISNFHRALLEQLNAAGD